MKLILFDMDGILIDPKLGFVMSIVSKNLESGMLRLAGKKTTFIVG